MSAEWDDLARLAQAATPGPWPVRDSGRSLYIPYSDTSTAIAYVGTEANAEFIAAANPATTLRLIAENRQLTHLLGSHADGHRCTCTMTSPGSPFTGPPEWEQDTWCPTHPDVDQIRAEFDALAARLAAIEALVDEWDHKAGPDSRARDVYGRQVITVELAVAALRAALAAPTDTTKET